MRTTLHTTEIHLPTSTHVQSHKMSDLATTMADGSLRSGSWLPAGGVLSSLFSLLWVRSCFRRLDDTTKALPQRPHLNGRSLARSAKLLPHSPRWRLRSHEATKLLSHCEHLWGLSPGSLNMRPHCGQRKGFSPEWVRWWLWKEDSWVKPFPQRLQR
uniref:Uncharacterized protein n=1 Tax=Laticauda laticaudata TaxID=8630 RepID=A0A8C5S6Y1_LATLA